MLSGITTNDMNGYIYRYAGIKLAERQLCRSKLCWKIPNHNCTYKDHDLTEAVGDYQFNFKEDKIMKKILKFLQGKKNIIAGIITTTSAFLAFKGLLTAEDATYINAISLIVFGSASVATGQMLKNK